MLFISSMSYAFFMFYSSALSLFSIASNIISSNLSALAIQPYLYDDPIFTRLSGLKLSFGVRKNKCLPNSAVSLGAEMWLLMMGPTRMHAKKNQRPPT